MKRAAKTFIVIGMILGFYAVLPIIFGTISFRKINRAKSVEELKGWGIATIFLVSVLGGIFMLNIRQSELDDNPNTIDYDYITEIEEEKQNEPIETISVEETPVEEITEEKHEPIIFSQSNESFDYIENIKQLFELYRSGALTKEEYDQLKSEQLVIVCVSNILK